MIAHTLPLQIDLWQVFLKVVLPLSAAGLLISIVCGLFGWINRKRKKD